MPALRKCGPSKASIAVGVRMAAFGPPLYTRMPSFFTSYVPLRFGCRVRVAMLGLVCACGVTTSPAMSLRELRTLAQTQEQGDNYVNYYLVGVMEGVLQAHDQDVRAGAAPVVCLNGRRLEPRMARELFDTELQRGEGLYEADMPAQLVLSQALATVYPC